MKIIRILILGFAVLLLALFLLKRTSPPDSNRAYLIKNAHAAYFNGCVEAIDNGRGLKIKLKNDPYFYDLGNVANDTGGLSEKVTFGDTLCKQINSDTILLKPKSGGKIQVWKLYTNDDRR
jgi:hypothetical protein